MRRREFLATVAAAIAAPLATTTSATPTATDAVTTVTATWTSPPMVRGGFPADRWLDPGRYAPECRRCAGVCTTAPYLMGYTTTCPPIRAPFSDLDGCDLELGSQRDQIEKFTKIRGCFAPEVL